MYQINMLYNLSQNKVVCPLYLNKAEKIQFKMKNHSGNIFIARVDGYLNNFRNESHTISMYWVCFHVHYIVDVLTLTNKNILNLKIKISS